TPAITKGRRKDAMIAITTGTATTVTSTRTGTRLKITARGSVIANFIAVISNWALSMVMTRRIPEDTPAEVIATTAVIAIATTTADIADVIGIGMAPTAGLSSYVRQP